MVCKKDVGVGDGVPRNLNTRLSYRKYLILGKKFKFFINSPLLNWKNLGSGRTRKEGRGREGDYLGSGRAREGGLGGEGGDYLDWGQAREGGLSGEGDYLGSGRALEGGLGNDIKLLAIFSRWTEAGRAFCLGGRAGCTGSSHAVAQDISSWREIWIIKNQFIDIFTSKTIKP